MAIKVHDRRAGRRKVFALRGSRSPAAPYPYEHRMAEVSAGHAMPGHVYSRPDLAHKC
jgi:hypothetical protein